MPTIAEERKVECYFTNPDSIAPSRRFDIYIPRICVISMTPEHVSKSELTPMNLEYRADLENLSVPYDLVYNVVEEIEELKLRDNSRKYLNAIIKYFFENRIKRQSKFN
jgi:hypothetical protein